MDRPKPLPSAVVVTESLYRWIQEHIKGTSYYIVGPLISALKIYKLPKNKVRSQKSQSSHDGGGRDFWLKRGVGWRALCSMIQVILFYEIFI